MRANIFTCPGDGLLVRPVRANAQVSRTAPIQIFLLLGTGTRECAPIFSHVGDGLLVRPVQANAQVSRTAPIHAKRRHYFHMD